MWPQEAAPVSGAWGPSRGDTRPSHTRGHEAITHAGHEAITHAGHGDLTSVQGGVGGRRGRAVAGQRGGRQPRHAAAGRRGLCNGTWDECGRV